MDRTKKCIEMCEKAEEIQKEWKPKSGDWISHYGSEVGIHIYNGYRRSWNVYTGGGETEYYDSPEKLKQTIWLPYQDQLQKMSGLPWWKFDERCNNIRRALLEDPLSEIEIETKEEAGICVVMEKYNKIWNGKEWMKCK